jgi:cell division septation protein DedD
MSTSEKERLLLLAGTATAIAIVSLVMYAVAGRKSAMTSKAPTAAKTGPAPKTPWGEPDLQGIWSRDVDTPLERPAKYANQEFFTDAQRAELDRQISGIISRDSTESRRAPGTERDVNSEFSQEVFTVHLPVGTRTSLIVDPPTENASFTPEAQKAKDASRQFQLASATHCRLQRETSRLRWRKT